MKMDYKNLGLLLLVVIILYCLINGCRMNLEMMDGGEPRETGDNLVYESQGLLQQLSNALTNLFRGLFGTARGITRATVSGAEETGEAVLYGTGEVGRSVVDTAENVGRAAIGTVQGAGEAVVGGVRTTFGGSPTGMGSSLTDGCAEF